MSNKKTAIYVRVSSQEQAKSGLSIDAQISRLKEYCNAKNYKIFKIYIDKGFSGGSIKRPAFTELIEDAKAEKFDVILVFKTDRFSRNMRDLILTLDKLKEHKINFVSLTEPIDTTSAMGEAFFLVIGIFAQLERKMTIERNRLIMERKFNEGKFIAKPFLGYKFNKRKKIFEVDEKKAEMIRDIFKMASEGINYREICKKHKILPQVYYNIIRNKVYIGIISFENKEKVGTHKPIIDIETFKKVNPDFKNGSNSS